MAHTQTHTQIERGDPISAISDRICNNKRKQLLQKTQTGLDMMALMVEVPTFEIRGDTSTKGRSSFAFQVTKAVDHLAIHSSPSFTQF